MDTIKYICDKYKIDLRWPSPFYISISRFTDIPKLFSELGFRVGAEIGVQEGSYSKVLLQNISGLKLFGVDLWELYPGYRDFRQYEIEKSYQTTKENIKGYDCVLIKDWSHKAVEQFEDESLDFVFIDGNHAYEYVVQDIALWSKKVRKGGIVYGHDYDDYTSRIRWKDMHVPTAVDGWVKSYRIHPLIIINGDRNKSWMYIKN